MEWLTSEMMVGVASIILLIGSNLGWWKAGSVKSKQIKEWMDVATKLISAIDKDSEGGIQLSANEKEGIIRELNEALGKVK